MMSECINIKTEASLLTVVLTSANTTEKRNPSEWLDLRSKIEDEKFRQLSADLERRRIRKYNFHLEELQKVQNELKNLQIDRMRFEREKLLRKRNIASLAKERKKISKTDVHDRTILPMNERMLGGSASIAFDPKVEKTRRFRRSKTTGSIDIYRRSNKDEKYSENQDDIGEVTMNFPYLSDRDVMRFHKSCKSAGNSTECRRWGAAWLCAKKEQDFAFEKGKRWTKHLLNAEKEKMKILSEKWAALRDRRFTSAFLNLGFGLVNLENSSVKPAHSECTDSKVKTHDKAEVQSEKSSNRLENNQGGGIDSSTDDEICNEPFFSVQKSTRFKNVSTGGSKDNTALLFMSPFSKGKIYRDNEEKETKERKTCGKGKKDSQIKVGELDKLVSETETLFVDKAGGNTANQQNNAPFLPALDKNRSG
ncbi:predicted protein [Nematostella vectensis]|uniref:Uncharacterized protein n=1 Tax=Nematostella vectensis TaxID=45351 RepID=A7RNZ4_NEMVE|nr:uncharacterized protein LOC5518904 [Nematostella vectensis]EDO46824.1 predicted protein [Nematostella vectensis]|eukprot:XP_001638887.1 predicted protein [Nematostella vectensis]